MCGTDSNPNPASNNKTTPSPNSNVTTRRPSISPEIVLNLEQGDPSVFEPYWRKTGEKCTMMIAGGEWMSYVSDFGHVCFFLEKEFEDAVRMFHRTVGNAVVDDRHIVVGTGSTQLYQAALYALTSPGGAEPISVVSAAPYYSSYPDETDYLRSGLYRWAGDAYAFDKKEHGDYIEVVNTPNNPDGTNRNAVVKNRADDHVQGKLIHDLAYYWPQYAPISAPVDEDIMYFTFSKSTGHAGSRIGWAIVKDKEIAKKMAKFVELSSLGVSKDSQHRAAKVMGVICDGYQNCKVGGPELFFEHCQNVMSERWERLREVVERSDFFSLPKYPKEYCLFTKEFSAPHPAFAWLECKEDIDMEKFIRASIKVQARTGRKFGSGQKYLRISMLSKDEVFDHFLERLASIKAISNGY